MTFSKALSKPSFNRRRRLPGGSISIPEASSNNVTEVVQIELLG